MPACPPNAPNRQRWKTNDTQPSFPPLLRLAPFGPARGQLPLQVCPVDTSTFIDDIYLNFNNWRSSYDGFLAALGEMRTEGARPCNRDSLPVAAVTAAPQASGASPIVPCVRLI